MKTFIAGLLLFTTVMVNAKGQSKNFIDQPYLEVSATADSLVTPNEIFIKITITEKDSRDRIPLEQTEGKLVEALLALGINTEEDLAISDMLSNYQYYLLKKKDIMKTKEYTIKVKDAATASAVFIKLEELGISNAFISRLNHTGLEEIENACRVKAAAKARLKAQSLATPLGQTVGKAIHIADLSNQGAVPLQGAAAGVLIRGVNSINMKGEAPKVEFEKIKVQVNITTRFILQ